MNTSSYLEAFLSIYGWMMYNVLYELFAMTWVIFLPFMILGYTTFIDTVTDSGNTYAQFKKGVVAFVSMLFVMFLALVPLDKMSISNSVVNNICGSTKVSTENATALKSRFGFDVNEGGKVPLLPSLFMRFGAGANNVIYQTMPCVANVNNFVSVINNSEINNPGVKEELNNFNQQCILPASDRLRNIKEKAPSVYRALVSNFNNKDKFETEMSTGYPGSGLYKFLMDADSGSFSISGGNPQGPGLNPRIKMNLDPKEVQIYEDIMKSGKVCSAGAVGGVSNQCDNGSKEQTANGTGPVPCKDWWEAMRPRLVESVSSDAARRMSDDPFMASKCYTGWWIFSNYNEQACISAINQLSGADKRKFEDLLLYKSIGNSVTGNLVLEDTDQFSDTAVIAGGAAAIIGGAGLALTGIDVIGPIVGNASSFYAEMFIYRVILKFLQPMLLMGIFTFWIFFVILANYRWDTVFKGLVLILIVTMLPGWWAITQHIDSALWAALYPDAKDIVSISNIEEGLLMDRMMLDLASTVFNIGFPLLLMYMVSEAGSGNPARGLQVSTSETNSSNRMASGMVNTGISQSSKGSVRNLSSNVKAGKGNKNLPPGGSRY